MEEYLIRPWAIPGQEAAGQQPVDWDLQVPPEIDALAEQVMQQYDMSVSSRTLITSKPDKGGAIWRIETNKGPRSLKLLHRSPERSLFSVGLQDYVVKQGARVPALIPANDGRLFVEKGGKLWIVTDWIALEPATKVDLIGAQELCYGLGEFHRHTKGYIPPEGAKNSSRLYRWPNYYQKIAKKIGWMREMALAYRDTAASDAILAVVDRYEAQAKEALTRLQNSAYPKMIAMGEPYWGLVHQDYGWSNGQKGPGGLWVIDLDGVAYDLPFRDLRKLITSTMDDMGVWDLTWIRGMIDAYHQANPLDQESYEVLLIDMAMPNEFYKHLKEMFFDPVTFLNTEAATILQRVVSTDQTKDQALAELERDKAKYQPGNYQTETVAIPGETEKGQARSGVDEKLWTLVPKKSKPARPVEEEKPLVAAVAEKPTQEKQEQQTKPRKTEKQKIQLKQLLLQSIDELLGTANSESSADRKEATESADTPKPEKRTERVRRTRVSPQPHTNVIDLVPYISSGRTSGKTKKKLASSKTRKKPVKQLKRASSAAGRTASNASSRKSSLARDKRPAARAKTVKSGRTAAAARKASRPAASGQRHAYNKVAAPRHRQNRNAVRKPSAARGRKKLGGLR